MNCRKTMFELGLIVIVSVGALLASIAIAEPSKDAAAGAKPPEMKLPPGWTPEDMQACAAAATPGKMHEQLTKGAGTWQGTNTMWMPGVEQPAVTKCTSVVTPMMDGRHVKVEMSGEPMPGAGPYSGFGLYGFDNVSGKFACTWVDNWSTGQIRGTGESSPDGRTITWNMSYHCPITKQPRVMRQVETTSGTAKTIEMFGPDPKSGKEYKMMRLELTKQS